MPDPILIGDLQLFSSPLKNDLAMDALLALLGCEGQKALQQARPEILDGVVDVAAEEVLIIVSLFLVRKSIVSNPFEGVKIYFQCRNKA